jgi:hypothetical protein
MQPRSPRFRRGTWWNCVGRACAALALAGAAVAAGSHYGLVELEPGALGVTLQGPGVSGTVPENCIPRCLKDKAGPDAQALCERLCDALVVAGQQQHQQQPQQTGRTPPPSPVLIPPRPPPQQQASQQQQQQQQASQQQPTQQPLQQQQPSQPQQQQPPQQQQQQPSQQPSQHPTQQPSPLPRQQPPPQSSQNQLTLPVDPTGGGQGTLEPCLRPAGKGLGRPRPFQCADALADVEKMVLAKAPSRKPVKIATLTIASGYNEAMSHIRRNRDEYARLHGYTSVLIVSEGKGKAANVSDNLLKLPSDWDSKGFPWGKMRALEAVFDQLPDITHVFWLDADIVLTNLRVGLEWLALLDFSFVTCGDENGINTGAFMMRNDAFSRNLLRRTWGLYPSFASHPWFEQGAMIGVIMSKLSVSGDTGMPWQAEANLAKQAFKDATMTADTPACIARLIARLPPSSKDSVLLVPQCLFGRRPDTWATGSFAVHFAGRPNKDKATLFLQYESQVLRDDSLVKTVALPPARI